LDIFIFLQFNKLYKLIYSNVPITYFSLVICLIIDTSPLKRNRVVRVTPCIRWLLEPSLIINTLSYVVYPSWADFDHKWENLPEMLSNPEQYIDKQWYNERNKISYNHNQRHQEFISGLEGGGIVIHDTIDYSKPSENVYGWRWLGEALFNVEEYEMSAIDGSPVDCGVCSIKRHRNALLQKLGVHRSISPQYHILGSYDHVESVESKIYLAIVNDKNKKISSKILELLPQLVHQFGLFLIPIVSTTPNEIATEKAHWFLDNSRTFYWFELKTDCIDVQRIFAFLIYCGLHLKKLCSALSGIQLVGQIENPPKGRLPYHYHLTQEEKEIANQKRMERIREFQEEMEKRLSELSPDDKKRVERYMKKLQTRKGHK
jgi:hypothetical protein